MTHQLSLSVWLRKNFTWLSTALCIIYVIYYHNSCDTSSNQYQIYLAAYSDTYKIAWKYWTTSMRGSLKSFQQENTALNLQSALEEWVTSERFVPEQTGVVTSIDSPDYKAFLNIFVETQHWTWPAPSSHSCSSSCTCSLWVHRLPAVLHSWGPSLGR